MASIIHARLDDETELLLAELQRRFGWDDSRIVREGIKALSSLTCSNGGRKIVGLGAFESDVPDLGSNKEHLEGFGG